MQCREINQKAVFDICVRNLRTGFQKYFVTVKPILLAQISEAAANAEAVIKRETHEIEPRRFSFRTPRAPPNKRKDSLALASTQNKKRKKDSPEYGRANSERKGRVPDSPGSTTSKIKRWKKSMKNF